MRITVLTNILTPYRIPLFEALAERTTEFSVLLMAASHGNRSWTVPAANFPIRVLPGLHFSPPGWEEPLHMNYGVGRELRRLQPDIVLNGAYTLASLAAYRSCRQLRRHHVPWGELTLRDGAERSLLRRQLRRIIIGGSSACIASSSMSRDAFAHYGMPVQKILVATMPVQTDFFARTAANIRTNAKTDSVPVRYGRPLLLVVGQLVDRKGFPELLAATQILQHRWPNVTVVVAGNGPQLNEYRQRALELGLRDVRFLGFVPPDELAALYVAADAVVFPTRFDSFGAVVPEAMAAGAILVASLHAAATRDLIVDGDDGFVVNPENPQQLSAAIARAVELPPQARALMGARASARACVNSFASAADAVMQFLQQLPSQGRRVARSAQSRSGDESKSA